MAKVTVRVDGLREVQKALSELPKATGNNVVRRVLMNRAKPLAEQARGMAPKRPNPHLAPSITVSSKRPKGQKSASAQAFALAGGGSAGRAAAKAVGSGPVEIFIGPAQLAQAWPQEIGTSFHGPQPYLRPSWDANKGGILAGLKADLWAEIDKAAARLAKKAARLAKKA